MKIKDFNIFNLFAVLIILQVFCANNSKQTEIKPLIEQPKATPLINQELNIQIA